MAACSDDTSFEVLDSLVSRVIVAIAKISRGTARYILVCQTNDGRKWAVAKRFSEFTELQESLWKLAPRLTDRLVFPAKSMWGGSRDDVVASRISSLAGWLNDAIRLAPPQEPRFENLLSMFLADDASVGEQTKNHIANRASRLAMQPMNTAGGFDVHQWLDGHSIELRTGEGGTSSPADYWHPLAPLPQALALQAEPRSQQANNQSSNLPSPVLRVGFPCWLIDFWTSHRHQMSI